MMLYFIPKWSGGHIKKCACACRGKSVYARDERRFCKCLLPAIEHVGPGGELILSKRLMRCGKAQ